MEIQTVGRRMLPLCHAVVAHHAGDAQPVIGKDAVAAGHLRGAMRLTVATGLHCRFVAQEGQGEDLARQGQAFEPLNRDAIL